MKKKVLVMSWHPDPPYAGGSFNCYEKSFRYHDDPNIEWIILDKIDSNLERNGNRNLHFESYRIPRCIGFIVKKWFLLGRPLEWLYVAVVIYFRARKLIHHHEANVLYVPIAEFLHVLLPAVLLKSNYKLRAVTILHQLEEQENTSIHQYKKRLAEQGVPFMRAWGEAIYLKLVTWILSRALKIFDVCLAISQYSSERFSKLFNVQFTHLEYGFDYSAADFAGNPRKRYEAVFLARLVPSKGAQDLILVWAKVVQKFPSAKLIIIGSGDKTYESYLKTQVEKNNLTHNVQFLGQITGIEKFILLKQSRLLLNLSHFESYCQVIDEAIVSGLPIVAYDLPVYYSRLRYTNALHLLPRGSYDQLAERVTKILQNPDLFQNTRHTTGYEFPSWESFAKRERDIVIGL